MSACVVLVTAPDRLTAEALARALVTERLAACVTLIPGLRSIYRWEGAIEESDEVLCLIKTARRRFGALASRVSALHPYDVPEIVALPITDGSASYLAWLDGAVTVHPRGAGAGARRRAAPRRPGTRR